MNTASPLEKQFFSFADICQTPVLSPSVRTWQRLMLCACMEQAASMRTRCAAAEEAALLRRQDLSHALGLSHCLSDRNPLEKAILLEQLCVDLACQLAKAEQRGPLKRMLDYVLAEDFDHIYRLSNLLDSAYGLPAELLTGGQTEIMPGRPTAAAHLHPRDALHAPAKLSPLSRVRALLFRAAAEAALAHYLFACCESAPRALFSELALIEEQHITQLESLLSPVDPMEELLLSQYAEWYLYASFAEAETEPAIRPLLLRLADDERVHLDTAVRLLSRSGRPAADLIPDETPPPLTLDACGEYVRGVLAREADMTCVRGDVIPWRLLPETFDYFAYQNALGPLSPSHLLLEQHIALTGASYRFVQAHHPLEALQNRARDPVRI